MPYAADNVSPTPPETPETLLVRAIPALASVCNADRFQIIGAIEDLIDAERQRRKATARISEILSRNTI